MIDQETDPRFRSRPYIPYGRQTIDRSDIDAVVEVLRSDWLTTGPKVQEFEQKFARYVGAKHAVAVSSGTAALHATMFSLGIGPGDEVIVPSLTFVATANCVVYQGGIPVFCDVDPATLLINPDEVEGLIGPRTKAVVAVDFAGQPCDYDALKGISERHGIALVADACHSLGGSYKGRKVGTLADMSAFSFHPVKNMTTGEGGMVTTDRSEFADRIKIFRNHGITTDHAQREASSTWAYEMVALGMNARLSDLQCALGVSQLDKVPDWVRRRREIAKQYEKGLEGIKDVLPLGEVSGAEHAYHLFVVKTMQSRDHLFQSLRSQGVGVNVHYSPVHLHPYYRTRWGTRTGQAPVAEKAAQEILSLPIYPALRDEEIRTVVDTVAAALDCLSGGSA